jgi:hypothetical protein
VVSDWSISQSDIDDWFASYWITDAPLAGVRKSLAQLAANRQAVAEGKMTLGDFDNQAFSTVWDAIHGVWALEIHASSPDAYEDAAPGEIHQLFVEARRLDTRLDAEYERLRSALASDSGLTDDERAARLQQLWEEQGGVRRALFYDLADRYRAIRDHLVDLRLKLVRETWRWRDYAAERAARTGDGGRWVDNFVYYLRQHFEEGGATPEYSGRYSGVLDLYAWRDYDWCKARPFADLQLTADYPGQFTFDLHAIPIEDKGPPDIEPGICWVPVALDDQRP